MTRQDRTSLLGIPRLDAEKSPELYAELYRIARRVRESERTLLGLFPIGPNVAVPPLALELAFALSDACEGAVAVVDANTRWPALREVVGSKDDVSQKSGFRTTWLADFVALVTPPEPDGAEGMRLEGLDRVLRAETQGFVHVLVDLTGFERTGEHWGMFGLLDGVLLVGHPGLIRERDLIRLHGDIRRAR